MDSCEFLAASVPIAAVVVFLVLVMSSMITYFLLFRKNKRVEYPHLARVLGSVTAQEFAQEWRKIGATDEVLQAYLSQMQSADVVSAPDGRTAEPETVSLLAV